MAGHRRFLEHAKLVIVDVRSLISRFLAGRGVEVFAAKNAAEGLRLAQQIDPDVVLSDINMPGCSGFEFLAAIRTLGRSEGGQVPVSDDGARISTRNRLSGRLSKTSE